MSDAASVTAASSAAAGCRLAPGVLRPRIDRNRCEGKGDCVDICPHGVFQLGVLPREARGDLSLVGRMKGWAHGWQQVFTPGADACQACGLCVRVCPERAITLVRHGHNGRHDVSPAAD